MHPFELIVLGSFILSIYLFRKFICFNNNKSIRRILTSTFFIFASIISAYALAGILVFIQSKQSAKTVIPPTCPVAIFWKGDKIHPFYTRVIQYAELGEFQRQFSDLTFLLPKNGLEEMQHQLANQEGTMHPVATLLNIGENYQEWRVGLEHPRLQKYGYYRAYQSKIEGHFVEHHTTVGDFLLRIIITIITAPILYFISHFFVNPTKASIQDYRP